MKKQKKGKEEEARVKGENEEEKEDIPEVLRPYMGGLKKITPKN